MSDYTGMSGGTPTTTAPKKGGLFSRGSQESLSIDPTQQLLEESSFSQPTPAIEQQLLEDEDDDPRRGPKDVFAKKRDEVLQAVRFNAALREKKRDKARQQGESYVRQHVPWRGGRKDKGKSFNDDIYPWMQKDDNKKKKKKTLGDVGDTSVGQDQEDQDESMKNEDQTTQSLENEDNSHQSWDDQGLEAYSEVTDEAEREVLRAITAPSETGNGKRRTFKKSKMRVKVPGTSPGPRGPQSATMVRSYSPVRKGGNTSKSEVPVTHKYIAPHGIPSFGPVPRMVGKARSSGVYREVVRDVISSSGKLPSRGFPQSPQALLESVGKATPQKLFGTATPITPTMQCRKDCPLHHTHVYEHNSESLKTGKVSMPSPAPMMLGDHNQITPYHSPAFEKNLQIAEFDRRGVNPILPTAVAPGVPPPPPIDHRHTPKHISEISPRIPGNPNLIAGGHEPSRPSRVSSRSHKSVDSESQWEAYEKPIETPKKTVYVSVPGDESQSRHSRSNTSRSMMSEESRATTRQSQSRETDQEDPGAAHDEAGEKAPGAPEGDSDGGAEKEAKENEDPGAAASKVLMGNATEGIAVLKAEHKLMGDAREGIAGLKASHTMMGNVNVLVRAQRNEARRVVFNPAEWEEGEWQHVTQEGGMSWDEFLSPKMAKKHIVRKEILPPSRKGLRKIPPAMVKYVDVPDPQYLSQVSDIRTVKDMREERLMSYLPTPHADEFGLGRGRDNARSPDAVRRRKAQVDSLRDQYGGMTVAGRPVSEPLPKSTDHFMDIMTGRADRTTFLTPTQRLDHTLSPVHRTMRTVGETSPPRGKTSQGLRRVADKEDKVRSLLTNLHLAIMRDDEREARTHAMNMAARPRTRGTTSHSVRFQDPAEDQEEWMDDREEAENNEEMPAPAGGNEGEGEEDARADGDGEGREAEPGGGDEPEPPAEAKKHVIENVEVSSAQESALAAMLGLAAPSVPPTPGVEANDNHDVGPSSGVATVATTADAKDPVKEEPSVAPSCGNDYGDDEFESDDEKYSQEGFEAEEEEE